jgi:hypothetical protein
VRRRYPYHRDPDGEGLLARALARCCSSLERSVLPQGLSTEAKDDGSCGSERNKKGKRGGGARRLPSRGGRTGTPVSAPGRGDAGPPADCGNEVVGGRKRKENEWEGPVGGEGTVKIGRE